LNATINNTEVAIENFSAAKSRIRDADFAAEAAEMARVTVMLQSGISVLSQANQSQSMALKLVG
jgi:flagellin